MITKINEVKTIVKNISCNCKCKFHSTTCYSNQKWNNDKCQCQCKKYYTCKRDYSWNLSICIYQNSRYLKSIVDNSIIICNKITNITDKLSTNVTNIAPTDVTSTVSMNSNNKKGIYKMDSYILHIISDHITIYI